MIKIESLTDLERVKLGIDDAEVRQVLDSISRHLNDVDRYLAANRQDALTSKEGMCLLLSRFMNRFLVEDGFRAVVLQGEVEIDSDSWLEHYVSKVILKHFLVIIDLSVNQLEQYKDKALLIIICKSNKESLESALKDAYNWWTSP